LIKAAEEAVFKRREKRRENELINGAASPHPQWFLIFSKRCQPGLRRDGILHRLYFPELQVPLIDAAD
jgi:hypothetical protein